MRCKNCGWENPAGKPKCEKCNVPLEGSMIDTGRKSPEENGRKDTGADFNPRKTVSEEEIFGEGGGGNTCSGCGYPLRSGQAVCPSCGTELKSRPTQNKVIICPNCGLQNRAPAEYCNQCGFNLSGQEKKTGKVGRDTVRPGRRSRCSLTLIPEEKEHLQPTVLDFSGEEVVLNRHNTEPDNTTITSQEQAVLIYENRKWYIQDKSALKTTYVYAGERVELHPGDVILLGDRRFEFDC